MQIYNIETKAIISKEEMKELDDCFILTNTDERNDIQTTIRCLKPTWNKVIGKMNGEEPDKKQDAKVKKPEYGDTVYYINYTGRIGKMTWINDEDDLDMWELGNIFFTKKEAEFAREKRKVEVELERYAKEHNGPIRSDSFYLLYNNEDGGKLDYDVWSVCKPQGGVQFASKQLVFDAIEAVGKERILKYLFDVDCKEETND